MLKREISRENCEVRSENTREKAKSSKYIAQITH
jgi:hypothetical protein